jgi:hypothetical protein
LPDLTARIMEVVARLKREVPIVPAAAPPDPAEVALRVAVFRQQLDAWTASSRLAVPLLGLPDVEVRAGACISCGEPLAEGRTWRCALCLRAVELTLGLECTP